MLTNIQGMRRRVKEERKDCNQIALNLSVTSTELAGYFIFLENWESNKDIAQVGWSLFQNKMLSSIHKATTLEAMWLMERCELSETMYLELREEMFKYNLVFMIK